MIEENFMMDNDLARHSLEKSWMTQFEYINAGTCENWIYTNIAGAQFYRTITT